MSAASKLPLVKLAVALLASIAALAIPLYWLPQDLAIQAVKYGGYWLMLATCALFLGIFWREAHKASLPQIRELALRHGIGLLLAALTASFLQFQEKNGFKILYDEHVLSSTAMNLHDQQLAYVQAVGHVTGGETVASIGHVDKRPLLFPFVLSVVHNVFGYDHTNVFALNAALTFAALALLYGLVTKLTNRTYGWFGLLLLGGLPLLAQNANGGGYEILNLCLILGLSLSAIRYFNQVEGTKGLELMIMTAILLANVRYESILYVLVPATLFLLKSLRTGKLQLTWFSVLSPLLLILPLTSFAIFQNEPLFIRTSQDNFFSLSHLLGNLGEASVYLFDWSGDYSNSVLLSLIGLPSILLFVIYFTPRLRESVRSTHAAIVLFPVILIALANTFLALCNHWGAWTDPTTSRFSLPLQLAMAICPALVVHVIFRQAIAPIWLILIAGVQLVFVAPGNGAFTSQSHRLYLAKGYDWAMQWVTDEAPPGNHLYIAQSASGLGLLEVGAIPYSVANANPTRILLVKQSGIYDEIFVFEGFTLKDGGMTKPLPGAGALSKQFKLETLAQFHLDDRALYRVSRITGLNPSAQREAAPEKQPLQPLYMGQPQGADLYQILPLTP